MRGVSKGSTFVLKAVNQNSGKQLTGSWMGLTRQACPTEVHVQVGTQSISLLPWATVNGSIEAAKAIIADLLTFCADRGCYYYYGRDTLSSDIPISSSSGAWTPQTPRMSSIASRSRAGT